MDPELIITTGRQCKIAKSSKCWIKMSPNRIFKMGC